MAEYKRLTCAHCGKDEELHWIESCNQELIRRNACFTCNHWLGHLEEPDPYRLITDDWDHRIARPEIVDTSRGTIGIGSGGMKMHIELLDGTKYISNNVWFQGNIPERFRDRFQINVKSIESDYSIRVKSGEIKRI